MALPNIKEIRMEAQKIFARTISGILKYPKQDTNGKPTGQGFGKARKSPAVQGKQEPVVKESSNNVE